MTDKLELENLLKAWTSSKWVNSVSAQLTQAGFHVPDLVVDKLIWNQLLRNVLTG
jgi:hypothetical protein